MSNNTNTLFWVITGGVIVLAVFTLINGNQSETLNNIGDEYSEIYEDVHVDPELIKYYSHQPGYKTLEVTDESLFGFDEETGTINAYYGNETNVVFPGEINGVKVRKIANMNLAQNNTYYEECKTYINEDPNNEEVQSKLDTLRENGILVDGVCQERVLLESVVIPSSVREIGDNAFENNNLKNVVLPNSINRIGSYAFYENQLESIKLNHLYNLDYIDMYAFAYNNIQGEVELPEGLTGMATNTFRNNDIKIVIIPKSLQKLAIHTFVANPNIETVIFRGTSTQIVEWGALIGPFSRDANITVYVPSGSYDWYSSYYNLRQHDIVEVSEDTETENTEGTETEDTDGTSFEEIDITDLEEIEGTEFEDMEWVKDKIYY